MSATPGAHVPLEHYVSSAPFEPQSIETLTAEQEEFYRASQWRIMWWKFRRHRIALYCGVILALLYGSALVSEILALVSVALFLASVFRVWRAKS